MGSRVLLRPARPGGAVEDAGVDGVQRETGTGVPSLALATGAALAVIGWTDVALLWYPLHFGSVEWEFGVSAQTMQAMPLGTIGLVLLAFGAALHGSRRGAAALAVVFALVLIAVLGLSAVFSLSALQGWQAVAPELRPTMGKAIAKTSVLAVTYTIFYAWLSAVVFRLARQKGTRGA